MTNYLIVLSAAMIFAHTLGCEEKEKERNPVAPPTDSTQVSPAPGDSTGEAPVIADSVQTPPIDDHTSVPPFQLAFVSGTPGNADIFLLKAQEDDPENLTQSPAQYRGLSWSPDGSKLAFLWTNDPTVAGVSIAVMDVERKVRVTLTSRPGDYSSLCWSPDGTRMAFSYLQHIYTMNADGSEMKALTTAPFIEESESDLSPAWSPDGNQIAFTRRIEISSGKYASDIYTINRDGEKLRRLTEESITGAFLLSWSPNGNHIAFTQTLTGSSADLAIYTMDVRDGQLTNLTNSFDTFFDHPVWSPDGSQIAFRSSGSEIRVMDTDGGNQTSLSGDSGGSLDDFPKWTSDGKQVLFVRYGADLSIYLSAADGSSATNLTQKRPLSSEGIVFSANYFAWAPK